MTNNPNTHKFWCEVCKKYIDYKNKDKHYEKHLESGEFKFQVEENSK